MKKELGTLLMGNSNSKSTIPVSLHLEVSCIISTVGFLSPIAFTWYYRTIASLFAILCLFVALIFLLWIIHGLNRGDLFPLFRGVNIRLILYIWGGTVIIVIAVLVSKTGGIQSSIFVWLFEIALVLTLFVRDRNEKGFKAWKPVWIIGGFETLIILLILVFSNSTSLPKEMDDSMSIWGGLAILNALVFTGFSSWVSDKIYTRYIKE